MKKLFLFSLLGITLGLLSPSPGYSLSTGTLCGAGDKAQVLWHGNWYPATVLSAKVNKCFIHYDGYGRNWDEWVGPSRIQITSSLGRGIIPKNSAVVDIPGYQIGSPVQVLWGGKWWPAQVLQVRGNDLYIHYNGYGNKWNEWVGPNRYR